MLREIHILRGTDLIYWRQFGDAIPWETLAPILFSFSSSIESSPEVFEGVLPDLMRFKVSYTSTREMNLLFVFVTDLTDNDKLIKKQLDRLKEEFQDLFSKKVVESANDPSVFDSLNPISDLIHKDLRPKIALLGFSGVGKTTITKLIRADEIPKVHNPTMTGDIYTVKIGKLHFNLWDFAGQEQFSFLWPKFVKDSDAVLIITDSTLRNIEKSRFFIKLTNENVPTARLSAVANKQDLPDALTEKEVEKLIGAKTHGMIAVDPDNRAKMIEIVAQTLGITSQVSPLIKPLLDRDKLVEDAEKALTNGEFQTAIMIFENIAKYCIELGDSKIANEFLERAKWIKSKIISISETEKLKEELSAEPEKPSKIDEHKELKPQIKPVTPKEVGAIPEIPKSIKQKTTPKAPKPLGPEIPVKIPTTVKSDELTSLLNKSDQNVKEIKKVPEQIKENGESKPIGVIIKQNNIKKDILNLELQLKKINAQISDLESNYQNISEEEYQNKFEELKIAKKEILYKITQMKISLIE